MNRREPLIHFSPRFHVNLYHSYRGDTPDEQGFGKDIRIIRGILSDLDRLQQEGITLRCAWDFDNAFSLGTMLPEHAPDIIAAVRARIAAGIDEAHLMSWNNGLLSAHTAEEFRLAVGWARSAPDGSGTVDRLGSCVPIVRPQENMFTPAHIPLYRELGIEALSVYHSAIPFNAVGSFFPPMTVDERFNPMLITDPDSGTSLWLLPAVNQGDLAEYGFSAARMLKSLHREQLANSEPTDIFVLLDMDADDTFWSGFSPIVTRRLLPSFGGLYTLVKSIAALPFVRFSGSWEYLEAQPRDEGGKLSGRGYDWGRLIFPGQDLADGAFDGYASWAEKYENFQLWSRVTELRALWEPIKRTTLSDTLCERDLEHFSRWSSRLPAALQPLAREAVSGRLRLLSTTHFGLSAPVMNTSRLAAAFSLADKTLTSTSQLLAAVDAPPSSFSAPAEVSPKQPAERNPAKPRKAGELKFGTHDTVLFNAPEYGWNTRLTLLPPWVEYRGIRSARTLQKETGRGGALLMRGTLVLPPCRQSSGSDSDAAWVREILPIQATGGAHFILNQSIAYPATLHAGYPRRKAERLGRTWDPRWKQTAPAELVPFPRLPAGRKVRVWKRDFCGGRSSYLLDYIGYGRNSVLSSISNHLTPSWIALSDGSHGILVAQNRQKLHGFAFAPLRQAADGIMQRICINPFGTYWGPQYRYPTEVTGWGRKAAVLTAEHLHPSAPSWEGKRLDFSLLIILYHGNEPPFELQDQAEAFSAGNFGAGEGQEIPQAFREA